MGVVEDLLPESWALARNRRIGFAVTDGRVVGISVAIRDGRPFAHLLSGVAGRRGWAVLLEPLRFFSRRMVIPNEFAGRESEYIRYNKPELLPVPESQVLTLRFSANPDAGETLLHGTRSDRLEELISSRRKDESFPKLDGVTPPSCALAAVVHAVRPDLGSKTIAVLVGARTTRYLAFRDNHLVNIFDDVHRPDPLEARERFRKTMRRVSWHMENEGLGGPVEQILLMGNPSVREWLDDAKGSTPAARVSHLDILREVGLIIPESLPADVAILAVGASLFGSNSDGADLNFIGLPKAVAARRFDAYDLLMYGSLAAMLALSFVTVNSYVASRAQSIQESLEAGTRRVRDLREQVDARRGILPVAEHLVRFSEQRFPGTERIDRDILEALPEFLVMISETVPDGIWLDRMSGGDNVSTEAPQGYKGIRVRSAAGGPATLTGQTRSPERAIAWAALLADKLSRPTAMEEMKLDGDGSTYRFKIVIQPPAGKEKPRA